MKEEDKFRNELIKMHEEDDNKHALQWFLNDIFELHEEILKEIFDDVHEELCCGDTTPSERHSKYYKLKKKWLGDKQPYLFVEDDVMARDSLKKKND